MVVNIGELCFSLSRCCSLSECLDAKRMGWFAKFFHYADVRCDGCFFSCPVSLFSETFFDRAFERDQRGLLASGELGRDRVYSLLQILHLLLIKGRKVAGKLGKSCRLEAGT